MSCYHVRHKRRFRDLDVHKGLSMTRFIAASCFAVAVVAGVISSALADVTYSPRDGDKPYVVRMTVTAAPEAVPALKYRLLTRDIDLKSGNAAPYYYRALMAMPHTMEGLRKKYNDEEELSKWWSTGPDALPLRQLPLDKVREVVKELEGPAIGGQLTEATARRDCDWELGIEDMRSVDVISFLLPEFQSSREISRMLSLRTRLAIAEHQYDKAIDVMRMNYRLAQDTATPPFLVCGLIGIAEVGITNGTAVDLISAPDSPNLYWALTELPQPMIDMRKAARFEIDFGPRFFPFINRPESADHSPQEWNRLFAQAFLDLKRMDMPGSYPKNNVEAGLFATGAALLGYSHAKEQLVAQGMDREQVEKMAVGQVMAIYTARNYQRFADDWEKLWYIPFAGTRQLDDAVEDRLHQANLLGGGQNREVFPIVSILMPAMNATRNAQVRMERDIAALRVIEALRMHAAAHNGQFPRRLDDISQVPVPPNPATSKPFSYRLDGTTAMLDLPVSDGVTGGNCTYEIQIATK
jgi:hypothetical protein